MSDPGFARLQARLQARHGERLTAAQWNRLVGVVSLEAFLARARETSLVTWLEGVDPRGDVHHLEERMRLAWIRHVERVAGWTPEAWRDAVRWWAVLPDLEVAAWRARRSGPDHAWFARLEGLERLEMPADVTDPFAWWIEAWRDHWPDGGADERTWSALTRLARQVVATLGAGEPAGSTDWIGAQPRVLLERQFRKQALRPGAVFIHLGLAALELLRLRGALCRRALFVHAEAA
ncbi:hypothetical protein SIID45300_01584 [Candidatus Magnetaquicoccaceae bacterium FCR-1]|uniref:Uncharacterized protein n=1 Tax=Candidatus Magnetaquiglobus chichijimensis TaxID=3141448 RepID=A0ABQ0C986_9PROT